MITTTNHVSVPASFASMEVADVLLYIFGYHLLLFLFLFFFPSSSSIISNFISASTRPILLLSHHRLLLFSLSTVNLIIMHFALPILAAIMAVDARPQGVTSKISPPGSMISGCLANSNGAFALAVMPIDVKNVKRAPNSTSTFTSTTFTTTTIHPSSTKTVTFQELTTTTPKVTVTPSYVVPVRWVDPTHPQDTHANKHHSQISDGQIQG